MPIIKLGHGQVSLAHRGGLDVLQSLLGFHGVPSDILLISVDLEVDRGERDKPVSHPDFPAIKEVGLAVLDTRRVADASIPAGQYICTQQFSSSNSFSDFLDCDITDFRECVFCETLYVEAATLADTINETFQVRDEHTPDSFRSIAIIGHSPVSDLRILCRIGVDVTKTTNVVAILDTHLMSQGLVGLNPLLQGFSLASLLEAFHLPFRRNELHNAGNDATYTLHLALAFVLLKTKEERRQIPINVYWPYAYERSWTERSLLGPNGRLLGNL
ncbi:hypothetical protein CONLIGDRAFT_46726 [Coniochaeta ligniaria NRRL 30616]|uniref:Gfd2/YDR514C-like C-terminal domain-containing protein n=1 Tax=Coniochaeta ligniaria NRRL 30616 TaxID=1408157 RepID=A0A1J7J623_9PEZI|nr:hypothetical protein CONLIGDRAFT_46726 [Coniochaeta ligniaria NRRL 30616]